MVMRFEGVNGNPIVSGIGLKRAAKLPGIFTSYLLHQTHEKKDLVLRLMSYPMTWLASQVKHGYIICNNCAAEIEISSAQVRYSLNNYLEIGAFNYLFTLTLNLMWLTE